MKLTIYLLRSSAVGFDGIIPDRYLDGENGYEELEPTEELPFQCRAWVQANKPKPPKWAPWLGTAFDVDALDLTNQSNSFVLAFQAGGRYFAATFGYGFNAVDHSLVEPDFGLKVTLNLVDPDRLDMLDTRTIDRVTRQRRTHLNVGSSVAAFQIDIDVDWIRHVQGRPTGDSWVKKVGGADSLKVTWDGGVTDLAERCTELLVAYNSDAYRERFEFIDHLRPLKSTDPVVAQLEARLQELLEDRDDEMVAIAYPELPDDRLDQWKVWKGHKRGWYEELELADIYEFLDEHDDVEPDPAAISVIGLDSDEQPITGKTNLHRFLVAQVEYEGSTFVLSLGAWFRADADFVESVRERVRALPVVTEEFELPVWASGVREGVYVSNVGAECGWLVLDQVMFYLELPQGKLEACDLLTEARDFVHVKDMKSSATLSHLFSQGSVSASTFKLVEAYATDLKRKFNEHYGADPGFDGVESGPRVVYAIATKKPGDLADTLFFFSAVNLLQHVDQVRLTGFEVALCRIERGE